MRKQEYRRKGAPASVSILWMAHRNRTVPRRRCGQREENCCFLLYKTGCDPWVAGEGPWTRRPAGRRLTREPASRAHPLRLPSQLRSNYRSAKPGVFILFYVSTFMTRLELFLHLSSSLACTFFLSFLLEPERAGRRRGLVLDSSIGVGLVYLQGPSSFDRRLIYVSSSSRLSPLVRCSETDYRSPFTLGD